MVKLRTLLILFAMGLPWVMTSCATQMPATQVKIVSRDPRFDPSGFQRALVIGVAPVMERRKLFEDRFASELRKHKLDTYPSYKFLPDIAVVDRQQIVDLVRKEQIDLVFITRFLSHTTTQTEVPGYTYEVPPSPLDGAVSYFAMGKQEMYAEGYNVEQKVAILETKAFESNSGTCLWTGRSGTVVAGYLDDLMTDFAWAMTRALYEPESLPPR